MMLNPSIRQLQQLQKELQSKHFSIWKSVITELCKDHQSLPYTHQIRSLISRGEFDALVELADSLSSQMYDDATSHFVANQFASLIRKFPFPKGLISFDPEANAKMKFMKAERNCSRINRRFIARRRRNTKPWPYETDFNRMRNFIQYTIGLEPPIKSIFEQSDFGPGASLGVHGNATHVGRKLTAMWTCTPGAYQLAFASMKRNTHFLEILSPGCGGFSYGDDYMHEFQAYKDRVEVVRHNKITFVPKTVKVLRPIAVEPLLNGWLQKGTDLVLRHRLKRIGINLSDQSFNQELARQGSISDDDESFVTIDLSSASDSIATEVVRDLLPPEWFYFLDSIRSKSFLMDGVEHTYHKFCSMGNGFCFPLETLIFTAVCINAGAGRPGIDFHVYGDDIIVRKRVSKSVIGLLSYMGFSVNTEKTFLEGPFRESCGMDWFGGVDVRPYTLDYALDSLENLFKFLNLTQRSERTFMFFHRVRDFVLRHIPKQFLFYRPFKGNADSGIDALGDEHLTSPHCRFDKNLQCWSCRELAHLSISDKYFRHIVGEREHSSALLYAALRGSASASPFTIRRSTKTKVRFTAYSGAHSTWVPAPAC